jgi:hypothetical protein
LNAQAIAPHVPFQPTATRRFSAADTLRIFGYTFWRSGTEPVVTVGIAASTKIRAPLKSAPVIRGTQQATFDVDLPLASLAPGDYVIEVSAQQDSSSAVTRRLPFSIR